METGHYNKFSMCFFSVFAGFSSFMGFFLISKEHDNIEDYEDHMCLTSARFLKIIFLANHLLCCSLNNVLLLKLH